MISRRRVLEGLGAIAGSTLFSSCRLPQKSASDKACPQIAGQRIRWITPNEPGGGFDAESRLIEPFYEERLGAEIVVENVRGAGGIIAAKAIMTARPDGLTLGIMNTPGLMLAALTGETEAPNPAKDFTILGRVSRSWHVWAVGNRSPFQAIEEILAEAKKRAIVFALTEVGTTSFVSSSVSSSLLGVNFELISGFSGTRSASLAAMRGEVDCVCYNFDSILDLIEAGDLRPLLQVSAEPISQHSSLDKVALLGGEEGWAVRRARSLGKDEARARETAEVLTGLISAGRVVVAPRGMEESLLRCLEQALYQTLTSPAFRVAAKRPLDVAGANVARADIQAAAEKAGLLVPLVQEAIKKARG